MRGDVDVATMAELLGHRDLEMVGQHYGHLAQKAQHLRDAARQAARVNRATRCVERCMATGMILTRVPTRARAAASWRAVQQALSLCVKYE